MVKKFLQLCLMGALLMAIPVSCSKTETGSNEDVVPSEKPGDQPEDEPTEPEKKDTLYLFSVSPTSVLDVAGFNPESVKVVLTTESEWTVSAPEWVSVMPFSGEGTTELTLTFFSNIKRDETTQAREGYVLFEAVNPANRDDVVLVKSLKLPVSQQGYTYDDSAFSFIADPTKILDVKAQEPGDTTLAITTQTKWALTTPDWVTAEPVSGEGDATITLTFASNYKEKETTEARSGEIFFKGTDPNIGDTVTVATLKVPVAQLGNTYTPKVYTLTADPTQFAGIKAQEPADTTLALTTEAAWTLTTPEWVTAEPLSGVGDATITLTFASNYKETETTEARSGKLVFKATDPEDSESTETLASLEVTVAQLGNTYTPPTTSGINSLADFKEFRDLVNAGGDYSKFCNSEGAVVLNVDLDFSGESNWVPIGYATAPLSSGRPAEPSGHPFTGRFSGDGHKIKNLNMVADGIVAGMHYGLFGTLSDGAVVENFIFENTCSLSITSSASIASGVAVGLVYDATVRDITSYASITFNGKTTSAPMSAAVVGMLYCNSKGTTVDSVHNYGKIVANNPAGTTQAGLNGHHIAGVVGLTHAVSEATVSNTISNCSNYGDLTSAAARTAGVVATVNAATLVVNCENRGNQVNSFVTSGGGRIGGLTAYVSGSTVSSCNNYGSVTSTTKARIGGIVSLPVSSTFDGCKNYGTILTDDTNRGLFFGYSASANKWSNCLASGKVGTYNSGTPVYDEYAESEKKAYLGREGATSSTFTNITYDVLFGDEEIDTDADFDVEADMRILFIGNSFTQDAVDHLPGLLNAAGLTKVQMVHMYYGGRTIPEYNNGWLATDYKCFVCNPGETSWTEFTGKSLKVVAASAKWDVVTLQEHTGRFLAWEWTDEEKQAIDELIGKVQAVQEENEPEFHYIMSQAYHDFSKAQSGTKPFSTQIEMYELIVAQARQAVEQCGFDGVIATGTMLQNLRTSSLNNSMGLSRDGYHMDYGISRYGASCTVFESIITPVFNVTLDDNTYRFSKSSTSTTAYSTPVTDENAPIALEAARAAIEKPYGITYMSGNVPDGGIGDVDYEEGSKE